MELMSYQPLVWLVIVIVLVSGLRFSLVDLPLRQKLASSSLRILGVILLILALCRPFWTRPTDDLHVVFLVDVSQSINLAAAAEATSRIDEAIDSLRANDGWSLFAVGRSVRPFETTEELAQLLEQWQSGISDDEFRSASQLSAALLKTRLSFPAEKSRRVVLFSDGHETDADIAATLRQLRKESIDVRFERLDGLSETEVAVESITPSTTNAFHGEVVRITVDLSTNKPTSATLRILHKGVAVQEKPVQLRSGQQNPIEFDVDMISSGAAQWTAEVISAADHFPMNNQAACTINVRGEPSVLILHEKPIEMRSLSRALRQQDVEVDVRGKFGLPESMSGMLAFDAICLANLPATSLSPRQMEQIKRYVADFGGGFVMLGSENSFGLGGYYKTPVEDVLPLVSRFEKEKEKPSLAMVLVIDKSGSMQGVPIALARQAAKAAVELLSPRDSIGVVAFDGQPFVVSEMRSASEADAVNSAIDSLAAGGGTFMYPGMLQARDMLENTSARIRHMIVLSDGRTQAADHEGLTQGLRDAGITVSTVALGGADRQLMATIAELGGGRYYETDDPANVPQIFTKETMQASRSAIKEDLFQTVQIGDHPLLSGYAEADLPFTLGYVMTEAKPTAQLLLVAETGDPLLAISRFGLGFGLAYTSDLTERWGAEWLTWDDFGNFWAQALRAVLRKTDAEGMLIQHNRNASLWNLDIQRSGTDDSPISGIQWDASAVDETGQIHEIRVQETGLGRYRAQVPLQAHKHLAVRLRDVDHDKTKVLHFNRPYPAEYRLSRELPGAIAALSTIPLDDIRADMTLQRRRQSISHYACLAALICLWGSVLLRRL